MGYEFHAGMKVQCVEDIDAKGWDVVIPVKGKIYTLRRVSISSINDKVIVLLSEIINKPGQYPSRGTILVGEMWWLASSFSPIITRKTDISIFKALLISPKNKVDA